MADENNNAEKQEETTEEISKKSRSGGGIMQWIIMAVVVIVCAAAGLGLSKLKARSDKNAEPQQAQPAEQQKPQQNNSPQTGPLKTWYYDELEPVVANLDEPNATRYIRVTITLEMNTPSDKELEIRELIKNKKDVLANWLTIYLGSLKIDDCSGKNKHRLQSEILNAFNEKLFPHAKPKIENILLTEFVIN